MISTAPDKILDNNALYMRLKLVKIEQSTEIDHLKQRIAVMEKEMKEAAFRCDTYK